MRTRRTNPKEPVDTHVLPERDLKKANELREKINKNHAWFPGLQTFKLKRKDEYLLVDLSS